MPTLSEPPPQRAAPAPAIPTPAVPASAETTRAPSDAPLGYPPCFFLPDFTLRDAAGQLLCAQYDAASSVWRTTAASFTPLEPSDCNVQQAAEYPGCFESHLTVTLPDLTPTHHPAALAGVSEVHRFVLTSSVASHLNGPLRSAATSMWLHGGAAAGGEGGAMGGPAGSIRRSNVGGFHSDEELFTGSGSSSNWYGRLHNVILEAVRAIEAARAIKAERAARAQGAAESSGQAKGGSVSGAGEMGDGLARGACMPPRHGLASLRASGWLNASTALDFNALHDHGDAAYSAVYYVDAGSVAPGAPPCSHAQLRDPLAGVLLLRTQLLAWEHDYAFLPVAPRPGDLWIFPGYMPHAVLPRALPRADDATRMATRAMLSEAEAEALLPTLRVSVACNLWREGDGDRARHADGESEAAQALRDLLQLVRR